MTHLHKARQFLADAKYLLNDQRFDSAVSRCSDHLIRVKLE